MLLEKSYTSEEVPLPAELKQVGVHPSVLHAVQLLFPKDRGLLLLALFCRYAVVQQLALPDIGLVNVAVIAFASVEVFAREHEWSKDTVLRYITILCALGILARQKTRGASVLYLPLTAWSPSQARIAALDTLLIEQRARPKLQQLARSVKERFSLLYGSASSTLFDEVSQMLTDVQAYLGKRLSASKRRLVQLRIEDLKGRLEEQQGDFCQRAACIRIPSTTEQGDSSSESDYLFTEQGGSEKQKEHCSGHDSVHQGDLTPHTRRKGDVRRSPTRADVASPVHQGDFQWEQGRQRSSSFAEQGDLTSTREELPANHLTAKGELKGALPAYFDQQGDFVSQSTALVVKKGDSANALVSTYNVRNTSFLKQEDSTNVQRELAEELAVCVEGHAGNSNQYERYLASTDSRLVLATYLYVQEEVWAKQYTPKPVKKPGAYFRVVVQAWTEFLSYEAACQAYDDAYQQLQAKGETPGQRDRLPGIPGRVRALVERFQGWCYTDVRNELAVLTQRRKTGSTAAFLPTQHAPSDEQEDVLEPEEIPSRWMTTETEAKALIERIRAEAPIVGSHVEQLRVRPYRVRGNGNVVYVVDALVERVPQVYAAPSQWEEYFVPLKQDLEEEQCKSTEHEA